MARFLLSILLVTTALASCDAGDDERDAALQGRVQALSATLDDTRARAARLERHLERERRRVRTLRVELERTRGVDLWTGGPTIAGTFLALPRLGTLDWTCDDARRFHVTFGAGGASVRVAYETPARARSRMLHSDDTMRASLAAGEAMTWTITHRHKPGFIRARVHVTTARSNHGNCLLPTVRLEERARLYD